MSKGKKRVRGIPVFHDEVKQTHGIKLTDSAWKRLGEIAQKRGISRSELVERYARSLIDTPGNESITAYHRVGATTEEQIEKNQPDMEWAEARIKKTRGQEQTNIRRY